MEMSFADMLMGRGPSRSLSGTSSGPAATDSGSPL